MSDVEKHDDFLSVLIVDDDPLDRAALLRHLGSPGLPYRLTEVESLEAARQVLKAFTYDVVLLDYNLGDGTGLDLLPELVRRDTPVVFVTGAGNEDVAVTAMKAGARDYVVKDHLRGYVQLMPVTIYNVLARHRAERERDRLIEELQTASNHIKELRELLPICCVCKRIRDDSGYWQSVEQYLARLAPVEFSHGYCPECYVHAGSDAHHSRG